MKNIKIVLIILVFFLLLISGFLGCSILGEECDPVNPLSSHTFWTINFNAGILGETYCEVGTREPYEGQYVNVYMEYDSYQQSVVQRVAQEFDMMYPVMAQRFGEPVLSQGNSYNGGNRKVTLLLFDIKDGYDGFLSTSYVGGYFYSVDYLTQSSLTNAGYSDKTNEQAIMYIDIYPQDVTKDDVYSTVAHEFQHMINFSEKILQGGNVNLTLDLLLDDGVPTWIDEGFAMAAERIWAEEVKGFTASPNTNWPVYRRISYFNHPEYFVEGNPLIKWIRNETGYDVLSNYSTSFLFFQYLQVHHPSGSGIFKTMMDSSDMDINMLNPVIQGVPFSGSFDEVFRYWTVANVVNASSGQYGYNNDLALKDVSAVVGTEGKEWGFYPGSFIYRKTGSNPSLPSGVDYIRFGNTGIGSGDYIVIYNPNTNPNGSAVQVNVPSGNFAKSKILDYDLSGPDKIDWLLKKPLSVTGTEVLRLPERNK